MGDESKTAGPGWEPLALDDAEKRFWQGLWRGALCDAIVEYRMDTVKFGSVLAALVAEAPTEPALNFILGAGRTGTVDGGHLEDALAWLDSHEVDYRVPVLPGLPEAVAVEELLVRGEHRRIAGPAKLLRDSSPPEFAVPAGIDVHERTDANEDESFGDPLAEGLGLPYWTSNFFNVLPGRQGWRCYCAADGDAPLAYAAMSIDADTAVLALASRPREAGDGDGQAAVLHHCILEAAAVGCEALMVAETGQEPPVVDRDSLVRAGFGAAGMIVTWRSPARIAV